MQTECWQIAPEEIDSESGRESIRRAARLLHAGQLVAFPTETVYGLGANALDTAAVGRIFKAKQRPSWDPLIVHIADHAMLQRVTASLPSHVQRRVALLADAFWPGPLTLLLPRHSRVPGVVTADRALVGVRMPAHPVALALIREVGVPVAAPSANTFGHVSPTCADHVLADLDGRIAAVLDGGCCRVGVESTVLDASSEVPIVYRPGDVTREQIAELLGCRVELYSEQSASSSPQTAPSPGVGIRHYAPRARLRLAEDADDLLRLSRALERPGVLLPDGWSVAQGSVVFPWADWANPAALASRLYEGLRWLDAQGVTEILCPLPADSSQNASLRDRLQKAAMR